jgi:hypothetical protein
MSPTRILQEGSRLSRNYWTIERHSWISAGSRLSRGSTPPFRIRISAFSSTISVFSRFITKLGSAYSFITAEFLIHATRYANRIVETDSIRFGSSALTVATIVVLQLPPSESRRTMVISELRYGTCIYSPFDFFYRHTITYSR